MHSLVIVCRQLEVDYLIWVLWSRIYILYTCLIVISLLLVGLLCIVRLKHFFSILIKHTYWWFLFCFSYEYLYLITDMLDVVTFSCVCHVDLFYPDDNKNTCVHFCFLLCWVLSICARGPVIKMLYVLLLFVICQ